MSTCQSCWRHSVVRDETATQYWRLAQRQKKKINTVAGVMSTEVLDTKCYGWGATSENKLKIGILKGGGPVSAKFLRRRRRDVLHQSFIIHAWRSKWMPYDFVADGFHTKKHCSRLFKRSACDFTRKTAVLRFCAFFFGGGGLRGNVQCSSYAHWKTRNGLPISVN